MKQILFAVKKSEYSYFSFMKVSFAGLFRRASKMTAQPDRNF